MLDLNANYLFDEFLLLRQPAAPASAYTLDSARMLHNEDFLTALAVAAPPFYASLQKRKPIDHKTRITLFKYYNRFCFRPTPFGLFAAVTATSWNTTDAIANQRPFKTAGTYLKGQAQNGSVSRWFFVRYEDHAPHIRLRLRVTPASLGPVLTTVREMIESKVERHMIREYQVDTIHVNSSVMVLLFRRDRRILLAQQRANPEISDQPARTSESKPYLFALVITQALISIAFPTGEERLAYTYRRYTQLSTGFEGEKIHLELDKKFRSLRTELGATLADQNYLKLLRLAKLKCGEQFRVLIQQVKTGSEAYEPLVSSLIHMHLNRLSSAKAENRK